MNKFLALVSAAGGLLAVSCTSSASGPTTVAESLTHAQRPDGRYISWREHRIDDQELGGGVRMRGADGLQMADLDKDGFLDIISVHEDSDHVRVAFGSEDPDDWFRLSLAEDAEAGAAEDVAIGDLNQDGFPDAVVACEKGHLLYLQNPGGTVRGWRWPRVIPEVTTGRGSFIRVFFADLNNDGRLEVVAANKGTGRDEAAVREKPDTEISWFEAPDDPLDGAGWKEHVLTTVNIPINSHPVDLDSDGDIDILGGSRGEERIFWLENLGGEEIAFAEHPITIDSGDRPPYRATGFNVDFHDFNGDGRLDIVLAAREPQGTILWLEQPADYEDPWPAHVIGSIGPDSPAGIVIADINGDEQRDVLTGGYSRGPRGEDGEDITVSDPVGRIAWFENPGDATQPWTRHDISRRKRGMYDAFIPRDMDGDGDLDFVATRGNSGEYDGVIWLHQLHSEAPAKNFTPAREKESEPLPLPPS